MKLIRVAVCLVLFSLVVSCATMRLEPPGPQNQAVLILPFQVTNTSRFGAPGFKYEYEIINTESKEKYRAEFKLINTTGLVMIDSLPPGSYTVSEYFILPVGPGSKTYNNQGRPVHKYLTLEYGHITLFQHSLNATIRPLAIDSSDGRVVYEATVAPMISSQESEIVKTLKQDPNFSAWKLTGN